MANGLLFSGRKNLADDATLSGGSYTGGNPLTKAQTEDLGEYAISSDATISSTQLIGDLGESLYARVFGLIDTNVSPNVRWRVELSAISSFSTVTYDTGFIAGFANAQAWDLLEWEDENWWLGTPTEEQLSGLKRNLIHVSATNQAFRYFRITVDDTENVEGNIRIPRVIVGPAWQFYYNMSRPVAIGPESNTLVDKSLGNVPYFDARIADNIVRFSLDFMSTDEAFTKAQAIERELDIDGEVLFIYDPEDTTYSLYRNIWGYFRKLSLTEAYAYGFGGELHSKTFEIGERF
jgi:hypothetical protein